MQSRNKPLADISNLVANAVGAAKGIGDELKAMTRSQAEKFVADMDLVTRDEFDVLKARLDAALGEIDALKDQRTTQKTTQKTAPKTATKRPRKPITRKSN